MIHDPRLTEAGIAECKALESRFPYQSSIELIVSSPLRRAVQTALCSFQPAINRGVKIVVLPELQETSDVACDTGSEVSKLEEEFGGIVGPQGKVVDLSLLDENWHVKVYSVPRPRLLSTFTDPVHREDDLLRRPMQSLLAPEMPANGSRHDLKKKWL